MWLNNLQVSLSLWEAKRVLTRTSAVANVFDNNL